MFVRLTIVAREDGAMSTTRSLRDPDVSVATLASRRRCASFSSSGIKWEDDDFQEVKVVQLELYQRGLYAREGDLFYLGAEVVPLQTGY